MTAYAGSEWLVKSYSSVKPSPLGQRVADLLGQLTRGLYHLPARSLEKATWGDSRMIEIVLPSHDFATCDFNLLTVLVVLCHDAAIRCEIEGCGFSYLKLRFTQRQRTGDFMRRHPTMEDAVSYIRSQLSIESLVYAEAMEGKK